MTFEKSFYFEIMIDSQEVVKRVQRRPPNDYILHSYSIISKVGD